MITVEEPQIVGRTIYYTVRCERLAHPIAFRMTYSGTFPLYGGIEGVIALVVPYAIYSGQTIGTAVPVSLPFAANLQRLLPTYRRWAKKPGLALTLDAPLRENESTLDGGRAVMTTFTLGVDSFYSLLCNVERVGVLFYVTGMDVDPVAKPALVQDIKTRLSAVADEYGKELVLCDTTVRAAMDGRGLGFRWGEDYHAQAIFCAAYGASQHCSTLLMAGSHQSAWEHDHAWSSSFATDPLFSSRFFTVEPQGDVTRVEKTRAIVEGDPSCLRHLRVCWRNPGQAYNCSRCNKCLRTLCTLERLGVRDKAVTFDAAADTSAYLSADRDGMDENEQWFRNGVKAMAAVRKTASRVIREGKGTSVAALCKSLAGQSVEVVVPDGNRGDGLIYAGARVLFQRFGVHAMEVNVDAARGGGTVLVYGSGGWCRAWHSVPRMVSRLASIYDTVWVLPTTFDVSFAAVRQFFEERPAHVHIMCREETSYDSLIGFVPPDRLHLDHDTAVHLDFVAYASSYPQQPRGDGDRIMDPHTVYAFRNDRERNLSVATGVETLRSAGAAIHDMSAGGCMEWETLLRLIAQYDIVYTDRAHISIAASLMGKETHVYPSNYFKVAAIFRYSLAHLPNAYLHAAEDVANDTVQLYKRAAQRVAQTPGRIVAEWTDARLEHSAQQITYGDTPSSLLKRGSTGHLLFTPQTAQDHVTIPFVPLEDAAAGRALELVMESHSPGEGYCAADLQDQSYNVLATLPCSGVGESKTVVGVRADVTKVRIVFQSLLPLEPVQLPLRIRIIDHKR